jgi:hypothetical protein
MTKEEGNCDYYDSYNQTCRRSDVPKEPCEDCISREEVCDYIAEFVNHEYATDREREMVEHIIGGIQHLPSIQPKPKTGRWIGHREHCENLGVMPSGLGAYEWCSNCDCGIDVREWHRNNYNFCPNCGVKMSEIPTGSEKG